MAADERVEVVVVGAGFSGLCAARELVADGRSVRLLEARQRVGGRVENFELDGGWALDLGAGWTGAGQVEIQALAAEFSVELSEPWSEGNDLMFLAGRRIGDGDPVFGAILAVAEQLAVLGEEVPPEEPWGAPRAAEWDETTFGAWLDDDVGDSAARSFVDLLTDGWFAFPPSRISLLHALWAGRVKGGWSELLGYKDTHRFVGGTYGLARRVAASLDGLVQLGCPVRRVEHEADRVVVYADSTRIAADRLVLAMPPALTARISFEPALPWWRDLLCQRAPIGAGYKCSVVYEEPWWRAAGMSGRFLDDRGPLFATLDASPPDGSIGVIVGYATSWHSYDLARRGLSASERRAVMLEGIGCWFGPRALAPCTYVDRFWGEEEWSRGDITSFGPGFLTTFGPRLAQPIGRIHFAGTETATAFPGEMEGAVRAGRRAAREVLELLG